MVIALAIDTWLAARNWWSATEASSSEIELSRQTVREPGVHGLAVGLKVGQPLREAYEEAVGPDCRVAVDLGGERCY